MNVVNFRLQTETEVQTRNFPRLNLSRWKCLTKPLNWLLECVGAYESFNKSTYSLVTIKIDKLDQYLITLQNELYRHDNRKAACFVLGFEEYRDLVTGIDLPYIQTFDVTTPHFRGVRIILHPRLKGAIAIPGGIE